MPVATPPARLLERSLEMRERAIVADVARKEASQRAAASAVREVLDARARLAQVRRELRGLRRRSRAH
jgi:hypothetical protein